MTIRPAAVFVAATLALSTGSAAQEAAMTDPENTLVMELKSGEVVIELLPEAAPQHVERLKTLAREGEYDNVAFHRVIPGFMAQTGDVQYGDMEEGYDARRAGTGGSQLPDLPAEFSEQPFDRGVLGMARSANPDSANSQFFITFEPAPHLNGQYTVVGRVVDGMENVDAIKMGSRAGNGAIEGQPDRILSMKVAGDQ